MMLDAPGESNVVSDSTLPSVFDRDEEKEKGGGRERERDKRRCTTHYSTLRVCVTRVMIFPLVCSWCSFAVEALLHARDIN